MEKNYISEYKQTHFYVNITKKIYGVCINIKDLEKKEEIINHFLTTRKEQINSWLQSWKVGVA